jgi:sugar phosphate isomerase/epimerase
MRKQRLRSKELPGERRKGECDMARNVTIVTGQWADLPFAKVCELMAEFGYDGLEICTWGDHLDLEKASKSKAYCDDKREILEQNGLGCWAIQNHLTGQLVCDNLDERHYSWAPAALKGDAKAVKKWAIDQQKKAAKAAKNLGINIVTGFTGSPIWHLLYSFPPCLPGQIANGYKEFAKTWKPILDVYAENGVKFALEVHPTEIAFDIASAQRALDALDGHPAFGFNFDPSHFGYQGVDYV